MLPSPCMTLAAFPHTSTGKVDVRSLPAAVVLLQSSGHGIPLFLAHGLGGGVLDYGLLARRLGAERPVYGLEAVVEAHDAWPSVEATAEAHIQQILEVQPHGPYALAGYSFGGLVAFEIARQLRAAGHSIALVAILDTRAPGSEYRRFRWRMPAFVQLVSNAPRNTGEFLRAGPARQVALIRRKSRRAWVRAVGRPDGARVPLSDYVDDMAGISRVQQAFMEQQVRAAWSYDPPPFPGTVLLLRARVQPLICSFDPEMGWQRLATGGVIGRTVGGSHHHLLKDPHASEIAAAIRAGLSTTGPLRQS